MGSCLEVCKWIIFAEIEVYKWSLGQNKIYFNICFFYILPVKDHKRVWGKWKRHSVNKILVSGRSSGGIICNKWAGSEDNQGNCK